MPNRGWPRWLPPGRRRRTRSRADPGTSRRYATPVETTGATRGGRWRVAGAKRVLERALATRHLVEGVGAIPDGLAEPGLLDADEGP